MKRTIQGVRYDTDKAKLIGRRGALKMCFGSSDWEAGLYVTPRSGRYFLAGKGGLMTIFANRKESGIIRSGEKIIPINKDEALSWAMWHLEKREYAAQWPDLFKAED